MPYKAKSHIGLVENRWAKSAGIPCEWRQLSEFASLGVHEPRAWTALSDSRHLAMDARAALKILREMV